MCETIRFDIASLNRYPCRTMPASEPQDSSVKNICVYCASSNHVDPAYFGVGTAMGKAIAAHQCNLVYGGGSVGIMGKVAEAVEAAGKVSSGTVRSKVIGIIPEALMHMEVGKTDCDELIVTKDMRTRKAEMDSRADAFITLPGGFGTLEELFEVLTHKLLNYHAKPIVIVNHDRFFDPLVELMEHMYEHRFAREQSRKLYRVVDTVDEVFPAIREQS